MLDKIVVEERNATFKRGHHARAIELDQDVVLQVQAHVHQQHLIEWIGQTRTFKRRDRRVMVAIRGQMRADVSRQERGAFLRCERTHPALMAVGDRVARAAHESLRAEVDAQVVVRHRQPADNRRYKA